jgi:FlaG/FlaF family flagellin (archaellin)
MPRSFRWDDCRAVSAIVAEILMVSITIVLAGTLIIYLTSTQNQSNDIEVPIGTTLEKLQDGNWTLTVVNGKTLANNARLTVKDPATGAATVSAPITDQSWYFFYNDNNANSYLDASDVILLNQTAGIIQAGWTLEIVKQSGTLSGPLKIP